MVVLVLPGAQLADELLAGEPIDVTLLDADTT
jgi:hypothetical protein